MDYSQLIKAHKEKGYPITFCLGKYKLPLGLPQVTKYGQIYGFLEKPDLIVNAGTSIVKKNLAAILPEEGDFSQFFEENFMRNIYGYICEGSWWHITEVNDLLKAREDFEKMDFLRFKER
ncbi:MAG: hypothetical protein Q8P80_04445 [Candidatus Levybacteria bacterium]|nr:hypothetical protein [Candidatus Levybacteria bacterium]